MLICLLLCRFGGRDSYPLAIGDNNDNFLAYGTLVGFAIIVPAILFTYLLGANLTILVRNDILSPWDVGLTTAKT